MLPNLDESAKAMFGPGGPFEIARHTLSTEATPNRSFLGFTKGERTTAAFYKRCLQQHAKKTFLVFQQERYTYAEFETRAAALANILIQAPYNVKVGDRVGICMRNYPEWPLVFIAVQSIGAISVAMNSLWKEKELEYAIRDSGVKVLCCDETRANYAFPTISKDNIFMFVTRSRSLPKSHLVHRFEDILKAGANLGPLPYYLNGGEDDAVNIMYTSGTTGNPKGVVHSNRGICDQMMMATLGGLVASMTGQNSGDEQNCHICPVPLFHVTGSHHIFLSCLPEGRKLCLMYKWDPAEALRLIEAERPTVWTGVPTMIQDMIEHPDFKKRDTSSLKNVGAGGAPTAAALVPKFASAFKAGVGNGYGLTETNGGVVTCSGQDYIDHAGCAGKAFPICEVKVVDLETGNDLPFGRQYRGELMLRSSLNMLRYWNKPEATKKVFTEDGWFRTGDIAEISEDGYVYIVDRAKDIVIRGGENISCTEVEGAFYRHPSVMECTAIGVPDSRLGEDIALMVYPKPASKLSAEDLLKIVAGTLANFKIPKAHNIYFTGEPLPRGGTGKILKAKVRANIAERNKPKSKL